MAQQWATLGDVCHEHKGRHVCNADHLPAVQHSAGTPWVIHVDADLQQDNAVLPQKLLMSRL